MTHIAGTLTRRLAPLLGLALVVAALGCREDAESPTAPEPGAALEITPAHVLAFRQVSGGLAYTCGVTTSNQAYCWGNNADGQLGDGTFTQRLTPVPVAGGLQFRQVNTGGIALRSAIPSDRISPAHTCGVTTGNQAYCWGNNEFGQLGDGTSRTTRLAPVAVAGGLLFRQIHPGGLHACGITTSNQAYCWGHNSSGELGDGTGTDRLTPVAVAGGLQFRQVSAGGAHTCGVTMDNRGFCWGANGLGQLGLVGGADRLTPVPVAGGLRFRQVSAGF
jgi:alpha-tubulin suppressor-like RCC1 family protein